MYAEAWVLMRPFTTHGLPAPTTPVQKWPGAFYVPWGWHRSVSWKASTRCENHVQSNGGGGGGCRNRDLRAVLTAAWPTQSAPPVTVGGSAPGGHECSLRPSPPHPSVPSPHPQQAGHGRPEPASADRGQRLSTSEGLGMDKAALQLSGEKPPVTLSLFGTWTVPMELVEWVKPTFTLFISEEFTGVHRAVL